jgi:hypothetical protein
VLLLFWFSLFLFLFVSIFYFVVICYHLLFWLCFVQ